MESRELNAKLLAEIAELRKENAEIPELREKLQRFSRVGELEQYNTELENRIAMLEQGSLVAGQSQHDNSSNNNSSNFNSVAEHHEKSLEDVCSSKQDRETDDFSLVIQIVS
ncbi:hypothetical protein F8M41_009108 [Gigaspora margarita]|uniref:Uncharacterized protein n=1 Tax=Gigaspora margarita TaxID=4874 RepID=A0A8H4A3B1_GIGMA|nr:hypothetical protein F8M41_009108 [Gigaspora margarita]